VKNFDVITFITLIMACGFFAINGLVHEKDAETLAIENKSLKFRIEFLENDRSLLNRVLSVNVKNLLRRNEQLKECKEEKYEPRALIIEE